MNIMMKRLLIFCIIFCSVVFPCLFLIITGNANLFIDSYAVDSYDRLYIGKEGKIDVYENGSLQYSIDARTSKSCAFTITENDCIVLSTASHVYTLTLQGDEISVCDDPGSSMFTKLQDGSRTFHSKNGNTYERVCYLGRTKIVKNDEEVVYQMDLLSFAVKILMAGSVVALFCFVIYMIVEDFKRRKKTGDGSLS